MSSKQFSAPVCNGGPSVKLHEYFCKLHAACHMLPGMHSSCVLRHVDDSAYHGSRLEAVILKNWRFPGLADNLASLDVASETMYNTMLQPAEYMHSPTGLLTRTAWSIWYSMQELQGTLEQMPWASRDSCLPADFVTVSVFALRLGLACPFLSERMPFWSGESYQGCTMS